MRQFLFLGGVGRKKRLFFSPNSSPATHPNEPIGFTEISSRDFNTRTENGWSATDYYTNGFTIESDASAPVSPPNVGRFLYSSGHNGGDSAARSDIDFSARRSIYIHWNVLLSANFVGHPSSGVNKQWFLTYNGTGSPLYFSAQGGGSGNLVFEVRTQGAPTPTEFSNFTYTGAEGGVTLTNGVSPSEAQASFNRGEWNDCELLIIGNTAGSTDAEIHGWLRGVKVLEYVGGFALLPTGEDFINFHLESIWGGVGSTPGVDQWQDFDFLYLSGA